MGNDRQCADRVPFLWCVLRQLQHEQTTETGVDLVCHRNRIHDDRANHDGNFHRNEGLARACVSDFGPRTVV